MYRVYCTLMFLDLVGRQVVQPTSVTTSPPTRWPKLKKSPTKMSNGLKSTRFERGGGRVRSQRAARVQLHVGRLRVHLPTRAHLSRSATWSRDQFSDDDVYCVRHGGQFGAFPSRHPGFLGKKGTEKQEAVWKWVEGILTKWSIILPKDWNQPPGQKVEL
jgi:hypothetical protein